MQETVQSPQGRLPSMLGRMRLRLTLLVLVASLPFVLWSVLPVGSSAQDPGKIQKKIDRNQSLIGGHKAKERVLTTDISRPDATDQHACRATSRGSPTRQQKLQSSLDDKRAELAVVQRKLREERARLTRLRARLLVVRRALAQRLVELYKADAPDAITVVLESEGFADLLTRADFMERVSRQDSKIMDHRRRRQGRRDRRPPSGSTRSRSARRRSPSRSRTSATRSPTSASASSTAATASRPPAPTRTALLASSRDRRHELEDDVAALQKQQAKIQAKLAGYSGPVTAGPVKPGSGGLIWPVNGPITSPFCESRSWESCHPGIDIGVPAGTPIRAAAAGKVVLMQGDGVLRRLRQLHLHPARRRRSRRVTRTSRASGPRWARRSARAR